MRHALIDVTPPWVMMDLELRGSSFAMAFGLIIGDTKRFDNFVDYPAANVIFHVVNVDRKTSGCRRRVVRARLTSESSKAAFDMAKCRLSTVRFIISFAVRTRFPPSIGSAYSPSPHLCNLREAITLGDVPIIPFCLRLVHKASHPRP